MCEIVDISLCSSRVSPDDKKETPCLGRDTIANAAADVGPAVVNISVSYGTWVGISNFYSSYLVLVKTKCCNCLFS